MWAVVPVKPLDRAKQRLAPLLAREERAALARVMLDDVLRALGRSAALAGVIVVTGDAHAASLAARHGALVLPDPALAGESAAATRAARHLASTGGTAMLVIPADVPAITADDVDAIVAAHAPAPSLTLVPASVDGGTNAFACSPPGAVSPCFGEHSLQRHCEAARAAGIEPRVLPIARLAIDVDRPGDLAAMLADGNATGTRAWLEATGIAQRLSAWHASNARAA